MQKLNDSNVPPSHIMQISGHKNVHSINNYSHINNTQHRKISSILSGATDDYTQSTPSTACVPRNNGEVREPSATILPALESSDSTVSSRVNNKRDHFQSIFGSSHIAGGHFSITVNNYDGPEKRCRAIIDSDSD